MVREKYISNELVSLVEFLDEDMKEYYNNWFDFETQSGFNMVLNQSYEEYSQRERRQRWLASIVLKSSQQVIGAISLAPFTSPPDLAIWLYKEYRGKGYGTSAFKLGITYCFSVLRLDCIYAGCYEHNDISMKMLAKCGFKRHPNGDCEEQHFLTKEPLMQFDFVLYKKESSN
jgi:Acetyltransferases, including N-acetylases of ribosomal proteins